MYLWWLFLKNTLRMVIIIKYDQIEFWVWGLRGLSQEGGGSQLPRPVAGCQRTRWPVSQSLRSSLNKTPLKMSEWNCISSCVIISKFRMWPWSQASKSRAKFQRDSTTGSTIYSITTLGAFHPAFHLCSSLMLSETRHRFSCYHSLHTDGTLRRLFAAHVFCA